MEYVYKYIFDEVEVELSVTVDSICSVTGKDYSLEIAEKFMMDHGFENPYDHMILFG